MGVVTDESPVRRAIALHMGTVVLGLPDEGG
jgi:hypothetical protein